MKHQYNLFAVASVCMAIVVLGCQSQDPFVQASQSMVPETPVQPKTGIYMQGYALTDFAEPPQPVADYFAEEAGTVHFPYYADGLLTFAVKVPEAELVSLWMNVQAGDEPDLMHRYLQTDWYWLTYRVPEKAVIRYHFNIKKHQDERYTLRDPRNPSVSANAPYESLWSSEAGASLGRLEYLEVPYDIPGREKPAGYAPPANRKLLIYVPPAYDDNPEERYPVIYMQDGQNAWDSGTANYGGWKTDRVMNQLIGQNKIRKAIVVSIFNTNYRSDEYAGAGFDAAGRQGGQRSGEIAAYYRDWVISVLKPSIDNRYRTLPDASNTGVLGSSYGGTVAIYWSLSRPDIYGFAGSLSYAPGDEVHLDGGMTSLCRDTYLPAIESQQGTYPRIWLDCGLNGLDKTLSPFVSALDQVLQQGHYTPGPDYHFELFSGADHNEAAWYRRLPAILEFLLHP